MTALIYSSFKHLTNKSNCNFVQLFLYIATTFHYIKMRSKKLLFLHQPVTCNAPTMFISKYNSFFTKCFPFLSFCVSFRVLLLCFLLHLFHLFPDISAHNVTSLSSNGNRSFSPSKRQIDDLLRSSARGEERRGVLNGKDLDVDGLIQPANNEQPFGMYQNYSLVVINKLLF